MSYNLGNEAISMVEEIDKILVNHRQIINRYSGKSRDDLGDELFDTVMRIADESRILIARRRQLANAIQEKFGITII